MRRPVSPLLHDYKSIAASSPAKIKAWHWFTVGLGLPLLAVSGVLMMSGADGKNQLNDADIEAGETAQADMAHDEAMQVESLLTIAESSTESEAVVTAESEAVVTTATLLPAVPKIQSATVNAVFVDPMFHPPLSLPQYDVFDHTVRRGDTLERVFRKNKVSLQDLARIVRLPEAKDHLTMLRPGDTFEIQHDDGRLMSLYRELSLTQALHISRDTDRFTTTLIERPIEIRRNHAYGRIETSLFESAVAAGLSDNVIMNLAGIFAWDVDFVLDIRTGDDYHILYEEIWQDGKFVSTGEIVAAEFNNAGRSNHAVRFIDRDGKSDYFTPEGRSVRKAFIRAPVDFTRISSNFNPRRRHPVLNTIRAHRGVDYAAPRGTPIKAAGDGKVIFRGRKGGYGNAIILQHGGNITTLYAHMSSFAKKARVGRRVKQGQTIGFVGSTGLATAAHLHYEYRLNGAHRNPRTVALPQAQPISSEYREEFLASAQPILDELNRYKRTQIASSSAE
ncbi:MAG: peptidoglycan DD-metalloendopeptidase family protein [Woeseia sp.]|nr:peptidoglycan DD-metalloendopeptidase family protein [Woeseia sp.]